jgi:hypothetical protein
LQDTDKVQEDAMRGTRIIGLLWLLTLLSATALIPQDKYLPAQYGYAYDQTRQQTFTGIVVGTKDYSCPVSGTVGSHITIKTDTASVEVHLAPASFMKRYEITIHEGDHVSVLGSKIIFEGKPALIARSVMVGRDTYNFRDSKGMPLW